VLGGGERPKLVPVEIQPLRLRWHLRRLRRPVVLLPLLSPLLLLVFADSIAALGPARVRHERLQRLCVQRQAHAHPVRRRAHRRARALQRPLSLRGSSSRL